MDIHDLYVLRSALTYEERKANHNATERARRETLNVKFQELASLNPMLNDKKKPSKAQIVTGSLAYIKYCQRTMEKLISISSGLIDESRRISSELVRLKGSSGLNSADVNVNFSTIDRSAQALHEILTMPLEIPEEILPSPVSISRKMPNSPLSPQNMASSLEMMHLSSPKPEILSTSEFSNSAQNHQPIHINQSRNNAFHNSHSSINQSVNHGNSAIPQDVYGHPQSCPSHLHVGSMNMGDSRSFGNLSAAGTMQPDANVIASSYHHHPNYDNNFNALGQMPHHHHHHHSQRNIDGNAIYRHVGFQIYPGQVDSSIEKANGESLADFLVDDDDEVYN